MNTDRRGFAKISTSASGSTTIIDAPTVGHIEIDHMEVLPSGGANTVTFNAADAAASQWAYAFDDNQAYVFDRTTTNTITVAEATAFTISLSAATLVTGMVLYRVVGEA